jgi:hypothetical protein
VAVDAPVVFEPLDCETLDLSLLKNLLCGISILSKVFKPFAQSFQAVREKWKRPPQRARQRKSSSDKSSPGRFLPR